MALGEYPVVTPGEARDRHLAVCRCGSWPRPGARRDRHSSFPSTAGEACTVRLDIDGHVPFAVLINSLPVVAGGVT